MNRVLRNRRRSLILFGAIILLQVIMMVVVSGQKQEYHIDEIYSHILSNSYEADKISNVDAFWGKWVSGESFYDFVEVKPGQRFAYNKVYDNNISDCHPPLYYWILHTICSLFPGTFSKWIGLGINILLLVIVDILVCFISLAVVKTEKFQSLPVLLYGFSLAAIDTVLFIRMYMLLTVWALAFAYLSMTVMKKGCTKKNLALMFFITYMGAMTHYYFIVFAFCATATLMAYLFYKKQYKNAWAVAATELLGIGAMLASYPYAIMQATGSSTNNVGNEVTRTLFDFRLWLHEILSLCKQTVSLACFGKKVSAAAVALVLILLLILLIKRARDRKGVKELFSREIVYMAVSLGATFLLIAYIGGIYVYVRYVYYIFPLFYILLIAFLDRLLEHCGRVKSGVLALAVVFAVSNAALCVGLKKSSCLFQSIAVENQKIELHKEDGLIVACMKRSTAIPTGNFTKIVRCSAVYLDTVENLIRDQTAEKYVLQHDRCLLYVPTDRYWTKVEKPPETIIQEILCDNQEIQFSYYAKGSLGDYYLLKKQ